VSKPFAVGAYANQRLNFAANGKAYGRNAKTSNRTWEIRAVRHYRGASENVANGGIVNPTRNRKGEPGNPLPKANASEFYPNH